MCELCVSASACMCWWICVCVCSATSPCLAAGQSGMGLSLAVVVRLSQRYEACCFIGQAKLLRQGFYWSFELSQSQMELHNRLNPSGRVCRFSRKAWMDQEEECTALVDRSV